jgi:hypothetical protein
MDDSKACKIIIKLNSKKDGLYVQFSSRIYLLRLSNVCGILKRALIYNCYRLKKAWIL